MKLIMLIFLLSFTAVVIAQTQSQSIMFKDKGDGKYDHLTTPVENQDAGREDKCIEMSRQIEELKGKPQRRYALMEEYQAECQRQ